VPYSNKHLVEVNCAFHFPEETTPWDSTFFGQYYEKIKHKGFIHREERKGVQITFKEQDFDASSDPITASPIEDQVLFRNLEQNQAILLGKNRISFHLLNDYKGWEFFIDQMIKPYSEYYKALGLGNGIMQASIVYLNKFVKSADKDLSAYFTIVSQVKSKFGNEAMTFIQRVFSNDKNLLIAKLNSQISGASQLINLECGAVCNNHLDMQKMDWILQANQTHEPILNFFEDIITHNLKKEL